MRHYILTTSIITALLALPANFSAFAENGTKLVPVYDEFNGNDVNGAVVLNIPADVNAEVRITFDSPEVTDEPYYIASLDSGAYVFEIEGRDNTDDDYRNYNIFVSVSGGDYNIIASPFTDCITVPDVNDNPDSYIEYVYNFSVDGEPFKDDWSVSVSQDGTIKNVAVHLNDVLFGDIDGNRRIDATDASLVLSEYTLLSTGFDGEFSSKQSVQADVNKDGSVNASDASKILAYYAENSTGGSADWDNL